MSTTSSAVSSGYSGGKVIVDLLVIRDHRSGWRVRQQILTMPPATWCVRQPMRTRPPVTQYFSVRRQDLAALAALDVPHEAVLRLDVVEPPPASAAGLHLDLRHDV